MNDFDRFKTFLAAFGIWGFFLLVLYAAIGSDYCYLDIFLLIAGSSFTLFTLLYIALDNYYSHREPVLQKANFKVAGASILVCIIAFFCTDEPFACYLISGAVSFFINLLFFNGESIVSATPKKEIKNVIEGKPRIERKEKVTNKEADITTASTLRDWFDFDALDKEKFRIYIYYNGKEFAHFQKDADMAISRKPDTFKGNYYYAEIEHTQMRDYYFPVNEDFDHYLMDEMRKKYGWHENFSAVYMCSYKFKNHETIKKVLADISEKCSSHTLERSIEFKTEYIDDFIDSVSDMPDIPMTFRSYIKANLKVELVNLEKSTTTLKGNTLFSDSHHFIITINKKPFAQFRKCDDEIIVTLDNDSE